MARVKRAVIRKSRKKKLFRRVSGFFLGRRNYRQARTWAMKSDEQAYIGRKLRKRHFRRLWIQRINAASRQHGLSYSRLVHGMKQANIELNRKMLADLAVREPEAFAAVVQRAQAALQA